MDFTSTSHPTRFISMAASSLDITLQSNPPSNPFRNNNFQHEQIRHEKQYIDSNSMINFEKNMQNLGNEFEKAQRKLAFSTNSLQSQLANNNIDSALFPQNTTSRSLSPILPNKTHKKTSSLTLPTKYEQISCIGSVIDGRLQNLRAKLHKLEREDEIKNNSIQTTKVHNITKQHKSTSHTTVSLPSFSKDNKDTFNTSFAKKYKRYMLKYHGDTHKKQREYTHNYTYNTTSHSFPEYDNNINMNTQNLVSRIKEKSKALFETDIDYNKHIHTEHKSHNIRPYIMDDKQPEPEIYEKTSTSLNFDNELNKTWKNTQLQLKKIKKMNEHFKRTTNTISVNESIASSHWTLDSQTSHSLNNIPTVHMQTLKVVNEEAEIANTNTTDTFHTNTNEENENTDKKVLNLSFNRGIQVRIPIVCSHCNKNLDAKDIAVISLENKKSYFVNNNPNMIMNQEEKVESIEYENNNAEINTTMSESDRKQLIMDLKSMDGDSYSDCKSDGILFEDKNKRSLRAKVNDLKMNMNGKRNSKCDNNMTIKNEEYLYLKHKLKIYESKLRNIDPRLLE